MTEPKKKIKPWMLIAAAFAACGVLVAAILADSADQAEQKKQAETEIEAVQKEAENMDSLKLTPRWQERAFFSGKNIYLAFGSADEAMQKEFEVLAEKLKGLSSYYQIIPINSNDLSVDDLAVKSVVLVGTPSGNLHLKKIANDLPLIDYGDRILFYDSLTVQGSDVLSFLCRNPFNKNLPIKVITGSTEKALLDFLAQKQAIQPYGNFELFRGNKLSRFGFYHSDNGDWTPDRSRDIVLDVPQEQSYSSKNFSYYRVGPSFPSSEMKKLAIDAESKLFRLQNFFGKSVDLKKPLRFYIYDHIETKTLVTGNSQFSQYTETNEELHFVYAPEAASSYIPALIKASARQSIGKPVNAYMETALTEFLTIEQEHTFADKKVLEIIGRSNYFLSLADLTDKQRLEAESPYLTAKLLGWLADMLVEEWGREKFLKNYLAFEADKAFIKEYEKKWAAFLQAKIKKHAAPAQKKGLANTYQKGFCFAHEGYAVYNGYMSKDAGKSLDNLKALGSNSVSITPFTFMEKKNEPSPLPFVNSAGAENDESVIWSALQSRKKGLSVMMKPHIWVSDSWPGDIKMGREGWDAFMTHYSRWIKHYAVMSEIYGFEYLSAGVELTNATLENPKQWRRLFGDLRKIYSGPITYSSNWGKEFEEISFWKDLDFIGLNCYYPLSSKADATDEELLKGADQMMKKIAVFAKRHDRKIVLTEAGFTNTEACWIDPYDHGKDKKESTKHQDRAYQAFTTALKNVDWCIGVYWWKWPSYTNDRAGRADYTPYKKPASQKIKTFFEGIKN